MLRDAAPKMRASRPNFTMSEWASNSVSQALHDAIEGAILSS